MLEPQGTVFFVLLVLAFAGLVTWLALTKLVVVRVLAAFLAFIPAAVFGIAVVNKYYDYYQTWSALASDLSGSGVQSIPQIAQPTDAGGAGSFQKAISARADPLSAQTGYLFRTTVHGHSTNLTRDIYVWLPPQYFQPAYRNYRFPVIELLHGSPGTPESWINVMDVIPIYTTLLNHKQATPAILVMPDTDGGTHYELQCLNYPYSHGVQDMTYVAEEVPDWVASHLRVMPPGPSWGIAGYSEGGYCAANIGLQYPARFGYVGSLSGYFAPSNSHYPINGVANGPVVNISDPFAGQPKLAALNTPQDSITRIPLGVQVPYFWLAAGAKDPGDVDAARVFQQYALTRLPGVPLLLVPGGHHSANVWRAALGPMLQWMTPRLTNSARAVLESHKKGLRAGRFHGSAPQGGAPHVKAMRSKAPATVNGSGTAHPLATHP
jgi:enterochelin esterase-like enzyme